MQQRFKVGYISNKTEIVGKMITDYERNIDYFRMFGSERVSQYLDTSFGDAFEAMIGSKGLTVYEMRNTKIEGYETETTRMWKEVPYEVFCDFMSDQKPLWKERFMSMAKQTASWSKDPSTKVGAVIVDKNNRVISTGYNGFARGIKDLDERLNNREEKYKFILHAEENAILFAKQDLSDCSIFIYGLPPCPHCASLIIQTGIKEIFTVKREIPERWVNDMNLSKQLLEEAGVKLIVIEAHEEDPV